jgi:uncharacterized membrane protein
MSIAHTIEEVRGLDAMANPLSAAVRESLDELPQLKSFLKGVWLGHPLHPAITDIPIGAWTTAVVLDATTSDHTDDGYTRAAETAITVGLIGAIGSAVTGLTDFSDIKGKQRRLGLVHGLINLTATGLFAASLASRRSGNRSAGRTYSTVGYMVAMAGAYLGGSLVFREEVGVDAAGPSVHHIHARPDSKAELLAPVPPHLAHTRQTERELDR